MYYIQVITCVSPPKDLWFLNTFEGCLEGKVTFHVIISVLRQKPVVLWLLLPPAFPVCHVLVPGVPGWAGGWHFRVCLSPWGRWNCAELEGGRWNVCSWQSIPGRPEAAEELPGAWRMCRALSLAPAHLQGWGCCNTIICTAPKNQCHSKWGDLAKALALSCLLIYSGAIRFCVSTMEDLLYSFTYAEGCKID